MSSQLKMDKLRDYPVLKWRPKDAKPFLKMHVSITGRGGAASRQHWLCRNPGGQNLSIYYHISILVGGTVYPFQYSRPFLAGEATPEDLASAGIQAHQMGADSSVAIKCVHVCQNKQRKIGSHIIQSLVSFCTLYWRPWDFVKGIPVPKACEADEKEVFGLESQSAEAPAQPIPTPVRSSEVAPAASDQEPNSNSAGVSATGDDVTASVVEPAAELVTPNSEASTSNEKGGEADHCAVAQPKAEGNRKARPWQHDVHMCLGYQVSTIT